MTSVVAGSIGSGLLVLAAVVLWSSVGSVLLTLGLFLPALMLQDFARYAVDTSAAISRRGDQRSDLARGFEYELRPDPISADDTCPRGCKLGIGRRGRGMRWVNRTRSSALVPSS